MMGAVCASLVEDEPQEGIRCLPVFRFREAFRSAWGTVASPGTGQRAEAAENPRKVARRRASERRQQIRAKKRELRRPRQGPGSAVVKAERRVHKQNKKRVQQEIFRLKKELKAWRQRAKNGPRDRPAPQVTVGAETGALPDFVIIGGKKCGTTSLYNLLTQHPYVEPAASKELHYFDRLFEAEDLEWYRNCFPAPRWENGRRTITGEGTPYMPSRRIPEMMAEVVPGVRLIALLRNPVDRAYSDYQQVVRKGREPRTFEEAIGGEPHEGGNLDDNCEYLSRGVYVDQLLRWSEFFGREQILVLKSEDFFERPADTLKLVLDFLELPGWEPEGAEVRNRGTYTENMDPEIRRRLEEYFEPHNRRLYEYLGANLGW
jgi:Sulfotransferase domain